MLLTLSGESDSLENNARKVSKKGVIMACFVQCIRNYGIIKRESNLLNPNHLIVTLDKAVLKAKCQINVWVFISCLAVF